MSANYAQNAMFSNIICELCIYIFIMLFVCITKENWTKKAFWNDTQFVLSSFYYKFSWVYLPVFSIKLQNEIELLQKQILKMKLASLHYKYSYIVCKAQCVCKQRIRPLSLDISFSYKSTTWRKCNAHTHMLCHAFGLMLWATGGNPSSFTAKNKSTSSKQKFSSKKKRKPKTIAIVRWHTRNEVTKINFKTIDRSVHWNIFELKFSIFKKRCCILHSQCV